MPQTLPRIAIVNDDASLRSASRAVVSGDIHLWYPEDYPECATRVTILDTRTPAKYSVMRFECGGHHEQAAGK